MEKSWPAISLSAFLCNIARIFYMQFYIVTKLQIM